MKALESYSAPNDHPGEVDLLLETIQKESGQRRQSTRTLKLVLASMVALIILDIASDVAKGKPFDVSSLLIFGSILGCGCAYGLTPGLRRAVTRAANHPDKRLLGGMIEALDSGEPQLRLRLENASADLLQQVTGADLGLLDDYQLDQLLRAVRLSKNERFCKAAVKAMGRIGSQRTLQSLDILINDPLLPPSRRPELEPHIHAAMGELRLRLAGERLSRGELPVPNRQSHLHLSALKARDQLTSWFMPQARTPEMGPEE